VPPIDLTAWEGLDVFLHILDVSASDRLEKTLTQTDKLAEQNKFNKPNLRTFHR